MFPGIWEEGWIRGDSRRTIRTSRGVCIQDTRHPEKPPNVKKSEESLTGVEANRTRQRGPCPKRRGNRGSPHGPYSNCDKAGTLRPCTGWESHNTCKKIKKTGPEAPPEPLAGIGPRPPAGAGWQASGRVSRATTSLAPAILQTKGMGRLW